MDADNTFLKLLSGSFREKLEFLKEKYDDKIAERLLEADSIIEYYSSHKEGAPVEGTIVNLSESLKAYFTEIINKYVTQYCRHMTLKKDVFEISFLPKYCSPIYSSSGNWDKKNRQSGKPGKIVQKVIGEGVFKNADYEQFVYRLKALWSTGGYELKLVKGEEIRHWYNFQNYLKRTNTLGHSCMSSPACSDFFDLYCEQPECQMLVALKDNKLAARALVWTINDVTFMDRVYYCEDSLFNILTNYAKEHKWYIRDNNGLLSDGDDQFFKGPEDNYQSDKKILFALKLKRFYEQFPYIDSFRYFDADNLYLYTYSVQGDDIRECSFTDGRTDELDETSEDYYYCDYCDSRVSDESDLVFSNYFGLHGCVYCMVYSNCMDDYIPNDMEVMVKTSQGYDLACESYLQNNPDSYVLINNNWYSIEYAAAQNLIRSDEQN